MFESVTTQADSASALALVQADDISFSGVRASAVSNRNVATLKWLTNPSVVEFWLKPSDVT
jgi:hypothetical protein